MNETLYEVNIDIRTLKAIAGSARAIHDEVTLRLDEDGIQYWCKDDRKECALTGRTELPGPDISETVTVRMNAERLADQVAVFDQKARVVMTVRETEDEDLALELTHAQTDQYRLVSLLEADEDDKPYDAAFKAAATCEMDLKMLDKIIGQFKRTTDVMDAKIAEGIFEVGYSTRKSKDLSQITCETTGNHAAKFDVELLQAAVKATKAVAPSATLEMMRKGPMRIRAHGDVNCSVYVVSNQPI